jgi:outer membrane scaffolding protein for murein synthesis (MipA/OmpV family)
MKSAVLPFAAATLALLGSAGAVAAQESGGLFGWIHGDWALKVGATGMVAPDFDGSKDYMFSASPIISLGKAGPEARFTSRNDGISISLFDTGAFRAGINGEFIMGRDDGDSDDLIGIDPVRFGGELGGFAEVYPTDWLRVRGEVRQGIRSHDGIVAELSADAFMDVMPAVRVSAGPRMKVASADYFDAYYGIDATESAASGLTQYSPGGGLDSVGVGGAIDWKATDKITTSLFGEYARLLGPAADSSLVQERGSENQFTVGVSASYRFDFTL